MSSDPLKQYDVRYKVLLLGDSGVGKTSLIKKLSENKFSHDLLTTIGIDFVNIPFEVDGVRVRLQVWDTAGQERFHSITRFHYRGTKGLLLVYDITNRNSFNTLEYWLESIENDIDQTSQEPVPVVIVGNKSDLLRQRSVSTEEKRKMAERTFAAGFLETSAALGTNVMESFQHLARFVTEVFNPEMTNTYKISAKIDKEKSAFPMATLPRTINSVPSRRTSQSFKLTRQSNSNSRHLKDKCQSCQK